MQEELASDQQRLQQMEALAGLQDEVAAERKRVALEEVGWMRGVSEENPGPMIFSEPVSQ